MVALGAGSEVQDRREYFLVGSAQTSMFATVLNLAASPKRFGDARSPGFSEKHCYRAPRPQPVARPVSGDPFQGRRKHGCLRRSLQGRIHGGPGKGDQTQAKKLIERDEHSLVNAIPLKGQRRARVRNGNDRSSR